jgi:hypothetical protein
MTVDASVMPTRKTGRPDPNRKPVAVTIKGNEEWKAWLEEAAAHCRLSVSALVDLAVARYAKSQGFDRKPPER